MNIDPKKKERAKPGEAVAYDYESPWITPKDYEPTDIDLERLKG